MTMRRGFVGLAIVSAVVLGICLLGSVPSAAAETLKFKSFNHVTKAEMVPIADVEGHIISLTVREGATVFENGEWAWHRLVAVNDMIKEAGTVNQYNTYTFLDGSTISTHVMGTAATPTRDIVNGTGRFQGIKGTQTVSGKPLPPQKGELGPKMFVEGTLDYTLPGK